MQMGRNRSLRLHLHSTDSDCFTGMYDTHTILLNN